MASLKRKISASVRKKRKEIEDLEYQLARAEMKVAACQTALDHARPALVEMEELLSLAEGENSDADEPSRDRPLRAGSKVAKAREVLAHAGRPMHVTELLHVMGEEDTRSSRTSLGGSLGGYARRGEFFKKVGANTFALVEEHEPKEDEVVTSTDNPY